MREPGCAPGRMKSNSEIESSNLCNPTSNL
jgi:hypothetical protein